MAESLFEALERISKEHSIAEKRTETAQNDDFIHGAPSCCICGEKIENKRLYNVKGNLMHTYCFEAFCPWKEETEKYTNVSKSYATHFAKTWNINGKDV